MKVSCPILPHPTPRCNTRTATNDLIPLAVTLEQTLTDNAATWVTTITPESQTAANEQADHTAQAQLTTSNALLTLAHQLTDNALLIPLFEGKPFQDGLLQDAA